METKKTHAIWEALVASADRYPIEIYPKVTIVIPTYNCVALIPETIESLLDQDYPHFEIIVVDASSTDRTLEVVRSYKSDKIRICSVSHYQLFEMSNKGILLAKGDYINFLLPGDFYLYSETLKHVMSIALDTERPELVYCGCLVRDGVSEVKLLFRPLTLENLKSGKQPTSVESCWFSMETFRKIGKFNPRYEMRAGFDLLCRFILAKGLRYSFTTRVLTDYGMRGYKRPEVLLHFKETFAILCEHFGLMTALIWLFKQRDLKRIFHLWMHAIRFAFLGR